MPTQPARRPQGFNIPLIIRKSDGGFGYASTDMAAVKHRVEVEKCDWIIYVTDSGQSQHFDMVRRSTMLCHAVQEGSGASG